MLGEVGRVQTIRLFEGPSVCGSCAAKLECFLLGRSARVHAAACVSQEDEDAELGCNSSSASAAAEALASTLPRASLKRTKTRQWTATAGSHERAFGRGQRMCSFVIRLVAGKKRYTIVTIYG